MNEYNHFNPITLNLFDVSNVFPNWYWSGDTCQIV